MLYPSHLDGPHPHNTNPLRCLQYSHLSQGADSESEISQPRNKRVKREHSSASRGTDLGDPPEPETFRANDTEAAVPARRQFEGAPLPGLHYNGASLAGGASSNFRGNLATTSMAAPQPGTEHITILPVRKGILGGWGEVRAAV